MRLAITRYSPILFDVWAPTMLTHWLLFPHDKGHEKNTSVLITMLPSYVNDCEKPLKRLRCSPHQRWRDRSRTTMGRLMLFHWNQVTWSWLKPTPTVGGGKWRITGEEEPYEVEDWVAKGIPSYLVKNQWTRHLWVVHWNQLFHITQTELSRPVAPTPP